MEILFQMSLIIFPKVVFLNLVLRLPSLRKLQLVIILIFSSVLFYRNYRTLLGIQHCLQRIPLKHFLAFYNKLNNNKPAPLRTLSKRKSKQLAKPWITKRFQKAIKIKNEFFALATEKDANFIEIKCCYFLVSVKVIIYYHTCFDLHINSMKKTWKV